MIVILWQSLIDITIISFAVTLRSEVYDLLCIQRYSSQFIIFSFYTLFCMQVVLMDTHL